MFKNFFPGASFGNSNLRSLFLLYKFAGCGAFFTQLIVILEIKFFSDFIFIRNLPNTFLDARSDFC